MIRSAERNKTPFVRIIDRYAGYYTPTILMLAIITWWLPGGSMDRVISLLVISCPCAVVLATPTTIVAAVAAAARLGVLIKNINHLELAGKIGARHTWLTHLSHTFPCHSKFTEDLSKLCAERGIRSEVRPAWDGLVIE